MDGIQIGGDFTQVLNNVANRNFGDGIHLLSGIKFLIEQRRDSLPGDVRSAAEFAMVSRNRGFGMPNQISTTTAVQDYLKAIYQLGGERKGVPTSALSERLGVSPASVSGMLKRLDEQGLVAHKRYQGARLTKRGARKAVEMIRHHRLLELYLAKVVGLSPDKVHAEADALEHVISEELESRLDELLGYPTEDPHGHPIPSADLVLTERDHPTLSSVEPGSYVVRHVDDRDAPLLKHLSELGVHPGAELVVTEQIPFRGGVRIAIAGHEHVVGRDAAHAVGVEEVPE